MDSIELDDRYEEAPTSPVSSDKKVVSNSRSRNKSRTSPEIKKYSTNPMLSPRTIEWSELSEIDFLAHGTGTSLFIAVLGDEKVVIKAPNYGMTPDETNEITMELKHEAFILKKLSHPKVIRIYGTGAMPVKDGSSFFFLAVEYLDGGTLFDHLKAGTSPLPASSQPTEAAQSRRSTKRKPDKLDLLDALRIGEDLAEALRYLHDEADSKQMILHRDIKPDNVGFLSDGTLRLFDFGLATTTPRSRTDAKSDKRFFENPDVVARPKSGEKGALPRYRMTGHTGSIRYMAPEVALDQPYNHSVDVYSFSVMLWEMVSGKKPYSGMNVRIHRVQVCEKKSRPALPSRDFGKELAKFLTAGWAHDMDARPSLAGAVKTLKAIRHDEENPIPNRSMWSCIGLRLK